MKNSKYLNLIILCVSILLTIEIIVLGWSVMKKTEAASVVKENNVIEYSEEPTDEDKDLVIGLTENNPDQIENFDRVIDGYYIKVNYQENVVTIYIKDEQGNYTIPYKAMICSTGTSTPKKGVYKVSDRGKWGMMVGRVWAQYYTRISGVILFHSVPYKSKNPSTLEYWEYDKLGTTASAGCVRLTVEDSKWIYDNCKPGTKVEFYADSDPGPLGKPTAQKISEEDESLKGWDPTDKDEKNPWLNVKKEKKLEVKDVLNRFFIFKSTSFNLCYLFPLKIKVPHICLGSYV